MHSAGSLSYSDLSSVPISALFIVAIPRYYSSFRIELETESGVIISSFNQLSAIMDHFALLEEQLLDYIKTRTGSDPAHDLNHTLRVISNAKAFAKPESADLNIVLPAAWLHDCVVLPKNSPDRRQSSTYAAKEGIKFLKEINYPNKYLPHIAHAIEAHSFSAGITAQTIEAKIVQDADRIDALGAIGIARCFLVGGELKRPIYSREDPFCEQRNPKDNLYTLDHFYQKLLKISLTMNTETAKIEALRRAEFMRYYLEQLKTEITPDSSLSKI